MTRPPVAVRPDLAELEPYGAPQLDVPVRLNTNETAYPPPPAFVERLGSLLGRLDLHRYPDRAAWDLRRAIGHRFALPPEQVWVANGSNEVLLQLLQVYGGADRTVLVTDPGYSMYPPLARITGTRLATVGLNAALRLDAEAATRAVHSHNPDVVLVASPNNPTGIPLAADVVRALHDASAGVVVVDEAYIEFATTPSAAELLGHLPRLAVTRTFSKAFRLAGIRLGYLLGPAWLTDDLQRVRLPYHLDAITQAAGLVACELVGEMTAHISDVVAERERLADGLRALGTEPFPSQANFLLFRTDVPDLFERLLAREVLVRDFTAQIDGCLRVTVGSPEENSRFLDALKECL